MTASIPHPDPGARLIAAALILFRRRGVHGVGVSEILSRAGAFAAGGDAHSALRAVGQAYGSTARLLELEARLRRDGWSPAQARDRAGIVLALLEGAGLVSHARGDPRLFIVAIHHGAQLCERG